MSIGTLLVSMQRPRLLVLVDADEGEARVDAIVADVRGMLEVECEVVPSTMWFTQSFARCGTWESWVTDSVLGYDYNTRRIHFDGFVVCALGPVNRQIARLAIEKQRPVFHYTSLVGGEAALNQIRSDEQFALILQES